MNLIVEAKNELCPHGTYETISSSQGKQQPYEPYSSSQGQAASIKSLW